MTVKHDEYPSRPTLQDLLSQLSPLEVMGNVQITVGRPCTDSRRVQQGDIFVAVKGRRADGHDFIEDAVRNGASVIVYDNQDALEKQLRAIKKSALPSPVLIRVKDTAAVLPLLISSCYGHPSVYLKLVGITGTNGKTTTSILIQSILSEAGLSVGRIGTLGYCWNSNYVEAPLTTPDPCTLQGILRQMVQDGVDIAVMEVSSHSLDQNRVKGCLYDVAVFTNLSQDHLDYHITMENYFNAKTKLFTDYLKAGGAAVINIDDPWGKNLFEMLSNLRGKEVRIITYGIENHDAEVRITDVHYSPKGLEFQILNPHCGMTGFKISSRLLGRLNAYNILAAISATSFFNIPPECVVEGIKKIDRIDGRLEQVANSKGLSIIVDYAHTPDAMEKALSCVKEWTKGRLIVVFGCGGDRDRLKRPLMAKVASRFADFIIITSDNPRSEPPERIIEDIVAGMPPTWKRFTPESATLSAMKTHNYIVEADRRKAIGLAIELAVAGDTIFIGGKGHERYQIIGPEKIPFDDRLVVMEFLNPTHSVATDNTRSRKCKE